MSVQILIGDVREKLREIPDGSVHCVVTSPPYWGLRDYGTAQWEGGNPACDHKGTPKPRQDTTGAGEGHGRFSGTRGEQPGKAGYWTIFKEQCGKCGVLRIDSQIGLEPTPAEFIAVMVDVFREVRRALRDDGTCWMNMGDSYASSRSYQVSDNKNPGAVATGHESRARPPLGLKQKDMVGMPWRLALARTESGREVIQGDFRTVPMDLRPTAVIGNPPFVASVFDGFLDRAYELLPEGARAGFILPTYFFQTAGRVCRYAERWGITQELLPRNAFHSRMRTPLMFAVFSKDRRRLLVGLSLYQEADALTRMSACYRDALSATTGSMWRTVCELALTRLGGEAGLEQIYAELERNRPSATEFWREKIRQTLRQYRKCFRPLETGRYRLMEPT